MVAVSICMPIYNVEKYLNQCLESIIQQTFRDFEVILIMKSGENSDPSSKSKTLSKSNYEKGY